VVQVCLLIDCRLQLINIVALLSTKTYRLCESGPQALGEYFHDSQWQTRSRHYAEVMVPALRVNETQKWMTSHN